MTPIKKRCEHDEVFKLLKDGLTKAQVRKRLNLKPSALANHLRRLETSGYIKRKGKFVIEVLPSSHLHPKVTKNKVHKKLNKRGHAFNFKVYFPKEKNLLEKKKVKREFETGNLKELSFGSLKLIKDKCTIWINKNGTLTIYSNNYYCSDDALHSKFSQLRDIDNLIVGLKERFGFSGIYGIEVFREHYGLIFNKFAKWLLKKGRKLNVKNKGNKTILWVDASRKDDIGLDEFEGDDPLKINSADDFFDSHEKTGWKNNAHATEENTKKIGNHDGVINKSMKVLEGYAEQIALHLKVEQKQLTNLDKQDIHFQRQDKHFGDQTKILGEIRDYLKSVNK